MTSTVFKDDWSKDYPDIQHGPFPSSDGKTVTLPNGHTIGYCEFVDPNTPTAELRVIVLLPGIPGSRLFSHPDVEREGCVAGIRLIVMDRPGLGLSSFYDTPHPTLSDFPPVFRALVEALELVPEAGKKVLLLGFSAGTPYALSAAHSCSDLGQEKTMLEDILLVPRPWSFKLQEISVPVAVWQGEKDRGTTKNAALNVARLIPGSKCIIVPDSGHMVYFKVFREVVDWLTEQGQLGEKSGS
eukprot:gene22366-29468_t